jgi:hypothetical protein
MRFKVQALVPAILLSLAINTGLAAAHGAGLGHTLLEMVASIIGLQVGFVGGLSTRSFILPGRHKGYAADDRSIATSTSARS